MSRDPHEVLRLVLRLALGLLVFFGLVALLAAHFRTELGALGHAFVARFGLAGMAFGTFLADAFSFPIPPQFYMLLSIASDRPVVPVLIAISAGSVAGGLTGYTVCRRISRVPRVVRFLERWMRGATRLYAKYGYRVVVIASVTPVAYSVVCWLAGLYRMPWRAVGLFSLLRVPRLLLYYYAIRLGWLT